MQMRTAGRDRRSTRWNDITSRERFSLREDLVVAAILFAALALLFLLLFVA